MNRGEIYLYLRSFNPRDHEAALCRVDELDRSGEPVHGVGMITLSSNCTRDCIYCWFSSGFLDYHHFRLGMGEIVAGAEVARKAGVRTLVLRAGDDPSYPAEALTEVVRGLTARFDFDLILALGERKAQVYEQWRDAGARGYWLRHETCDPFLYRRIRPTMFGVDRMRSLKAIPEAGLALASGLLIGIPNQTYESLVEDLLFFSDQDPDRALFGLDVEAFWPPPGSQGAELLKKPEHVIVAPDPVTIEKVIAVSRLLRPDILIPLSYPLVAKLQALDHNRLFRAGANGILLDFTPVQSDIYRHTLFSGAPVQTPGDLDYIRKRIAALGHELVLDRPLVPAS